MKLTYKHTLTACYIGGITQAIVNNFAPLLFVTFNKEFGISIELISILITLNFGVQIITDISSVRLIEKIGFRKGAMLSYILSFLGLILMMSLPFIMPNKFIALAISTVISAIGSGLTEVLTSPIVDSLPSKEKSSAMSMLHSFYCWGCVLVIVVSTLFFKFFGIQNWQYLTVLWAIVPLFNIFLFMLVPLSDKIEHTQDMSLKGLFKSKIFVLCLVLMICAGATEQAISQWASLFAEKGLNVSKETGDILGPCMFAVFMGIARTLYGIYGAKLKLHRALLISSSLAVVTYLITALAKNPMISLLGCSISGVAAGIMWPGVLSLCSQNSKNPTPAMFAFLAVGGDIGCTFGPSLVGFVSSFVKKINVPLSNGIIFANDIESLGLKMGLFVVAFIPVIMIIVLKKFKNFSTKAE